jgi:hypothetical protein
MADTLHLSALRTQSLSFRIKEFTDYKIVDIANQTLVKAIRDEAILKGMPPRYIDGIQSEYDGKELWIWVNFKGKKGEPLDKYFEEGTKDHKIKPRNKKALAFFNKGAIGIVTGLRRFSKGHWVSGIEARHIFGNGLKKGYPQFKKKLTQELEAYLRETNLFG